MPSQSQNKPFPIRLEPELREKVKEAGGGPLVRSLLESFFGGSTEPEIRRLEAELKTLEKMPLKKLEMVDVEIVHDDLLAILRWEKKEIKRYQALVLLGRTELLKARKMKKGSRWAK